MNQKNKCIQYLDRIRNLNEKVKQYLTVLEKELEQNQKDSEIPPLFLRDPNNLKVFKKFQKTLDQLESIFQAIVNFNLQQLCNNLIEVLEINEEYIKTINLEGILKIISTYEEYKNLEKEIKESLYFENIHELLTLKIKENLPILAKHEAYSMKETPDKTGLEIDYINYAEVILVEEGLNALDNFIAKVSLDFFINLFSSSEFLKFLTNTDSYIYQIKEDFKQNLEDLKKLENDAKNLANEISNYINELQNRKQLFFKTKKEIEEFLAQEVLKEISKEYEKKATEFFAFKVSKKIPIIGGKYYKLSKWFAFFFLSMLLILGPLFLMPLLLDGKTWHDALIKASIGFIPIAVGFYLLRYSLKLRDLQEEYKFKSIMLSSLPALSLLIEDKAERDKLITTLLLEGANLQTLTKDKGEIVKEILPIVELANKLRNN